MKLPIIKIKAQRPERLCHPWIYDNEIVDGPEAGFVDGNLVSAFDNKERYLGTGFLNRKSRIAFRYLTRNADEVVDGQFWLKRVESAYQYRRDRYEANGGLPEAYRLIHGEADGMPGLTADVYGSFVVIQVVALGLEIWRKDLLESIVKTLGSRGIYERSDTAQRVLEGLDEKVGLVAGEEPPEQLDLNDNGLRLLVDIKGGAKTGLFLDQRENQWAAACEAEGREVLNCFAYTGLFGLKAAYRQAASVVDVETSAKFNLINSRQWELNRFPVKHAIEASNVFDHLRSLCRQGYQTDMVILDPPAFTKSRANIDGAARGYNEINRVALKLLRSGGVLVTCSCSHHLHLEEFYGIIQKAAMDAKRELKLICERGQPADHPVLLNASESQYLKCLIFAVD